MLAYVRHSDDLATLFVILALLCFVAAAYTAYLRNFMATALLVLVGVLALIFGA
jgi:hypothetical protein